jgi:hypothetical protein
MLCKLVCTWHVCVLVWLLQPSGLVAATLLLVLQLCLLLLLHALAVGSFDATQSLLGRQEKRSNM